MAIGYDLGPLASVLEAGERSSPTTRSLTSSGCGRSATCACPKVCCTLTAARLATAGTKPGNNLDACLERYLNVPPGKDQSRSDWGSMLLTEDQVAYAARDVAHLHNLAGVLEREIEMSGLEDVWALESALLPRVVEMEAAGIHVDVDPAEGDRRESQCRRCEGLGRSSRSPGKSRASTRPALKQLLAALRAEGIPLDSTAEETLKSADDGRIIPLILAYREASKRAQQAEALVGHVRDDGRIHARFEPTGTATGRFSSKDPNLQNIGRGELREAFTPPPGHRFIVADYSQVELRAAAAIAGEKKMIDAYRDGADLHRLTASTVLGKPEDEVTKSDRQTAKSCNFGLIYGQSAPGLVRYAASSYGVTLEVEEAREIRTAFFRTYARSCASGTASATRRPSRA